jgi:putative transposase
VRLLRLIRASFEASYSIYGAPGVFLDQRKAGETCSKHGMMRLMRVNKIRADRGYRIPHDSGPRRMLAEHSLIHGPASSEGDG